MTLGCNKKFLESDKKLQSRVISYLLGCAARPGRLFCVQPQRKGMKMGSCFSQSASQWAPSTWQ